MMQEMLHLGGKSKMKQLKTLDWVGIFLFSTGLVVFLIGMNWGGSAYPWKSGHVLGALFAGFGTLVAFCFWEAYSGLDYPLIPMRLFKKVEYDANVACASLAAIVYYANSIIWPTMVSSLFTTDVTEIGWLSVSGRSEKPSSNYYMKLTHIPVRRRRWPPPRPDPRRRRSPLSPADEDPNDRRRHNNHRLRRRCRRFRRQYT
jgi:hypothetical protein